MFLVKIVQYKVFHNDNTFYSSIYIPIFSISVMGNGRFKIVLESQCTIQLNGWWLRDQSYISFWFFRFIFSADWSNQTKHCQVTIRFQKVLPVYFWHVLLYSSLLVRLFQPLSWSGKLKVLNFSNFTLWNFTFQLWPKVLLKVVIMKKIWELKKSSVTWRQKEKGVASSWQSHINFS